VRTADTLSDADTAILPAIAYLPREREHEGKLVVAAVLPLPRDRNLTAAGGWALRGAWAAFGLLGVEAR
jgi:hypothetical protein